MFRASASLFGSSVVPREPSYQLLPTLPEALEEGSWLVDLCRGVGYSCIAMQGWVACAGRPYVRADTECSPHWSPMARCPMQAAVSCLRRVPLPCPLPVPVGR